MCDIIEKLGMTPGPWEIKESLGDSNRGFNSSNGDMVPHGSCWIESAFNGCDATIESKANDNLIAAAPEMLKALIDACDMICSLCIRLNPQHKDCPSCEDLDDLRKPIEKAANMSWEKLKALL